MKVLNRLSFVCSVFCLFCFAGCQSDPSGGKIILPEEVYEIVYDSSRVSQYTIVDVRRRMDYIRGHIVSALWLNPDSLREKLPTFISEKKPLIIYGHRGIHMADLYSTLSENGIPFFEMHGGFSRWTELGFPAAIRLVKNTSDKVAIQRKDLSITIAMALLNSMSTRFELIDVRPYAAYTERHIDGALSVPYVPLNEFVVRIEELNFRRTQPIILYSDAQSDVGEKAADVMLRNDFTQVYLLKCDLAEWEEGPARSD